MRLSALTLLALLSASANPINAQSTCSCSPVSYTYTLTLDGTCSDNTVENPGILSTDCTIVTGETNALVDGNPGNTLSLEDILFGIPWIRKRVIKRQSNRYRNKNARTIGQKNHQTNQSNQEATSNGEDIRLLQSNEVPISINSIQFIELDAIGNVINIDESLIDIDVTDGFTFTFNSVSAQLATDLVIEDQLDFVPETAVVFLIGTNSQGDEVRGRFVTRFTNGCADDALTVVGGEEFGWLSYVSLIDYQHFTCKLVQFFVLF